MTIASSLTRSLFNSKVDHTPEALNEKQEQPTLGAVEKARVRLGMEKNMFSRESDFIPITTVSTGSKPYLQAKSNGSQSVVLGDTAGTSVAVVERDGSAFKIYAPADDTSGHRAPLAEITQVGKVLKVVLKGESEPTYTIHKVISHPLKQFATKHVIKNKGSPVASTRYGKGNSYLLTVNAGADSCLMSCLAAIADEIHV